MKFPRRGRKPKKAKRPKKPPKNLAAWPDLATANVPMNRPAMRGVFHAIAAILWLPFAGALLATAPAGHAWWATLMFSASVLVVFGTSALYHRHTWTPKGLDRMKRLDHAAIGVGIVGFVLSFALLARGWPGAEPHFWRMGLGGLVVVARALFWPDAPKVFSVALGVALVVLAMPIGQEAMARLPDAGIWALVGGNSVMGLGALAYAINRPNPWPGVVGYHEVFHLATVLGVGGYAWALVTLLWALGAGT